ncbi:3-hydroxyacyl-CoA dehydrogenase [Pseudomaricurvus alkylphenolicus]|uniref:3-hydroxyacyl-CoA dehydrogenase n=1 Tax=Pseudomaricurvus alkylphenolicus TaxID=1306991 RepID=UPI00197F73CF|nr:3-hydroxyacyl-CoA dehydrogenase [Pseudomaricurvus alkylphenolicus]
MIEKTNKVAVVGSGLMGTGIAHAFASSGYPTLLIDTNPEALARAEKSIYDILDGGVVKGKMSETQAIEAKALLSTATDLAQTPADTSLLVETVSEKLNIKQKVVKAAESVLNADTIIATNTSALSVTEIASVLERPERVIGMHFFNPVHKMKLVELVLAIATNEETIAASRDWCEALGKTSILVNESPGLTTSRMSAMLGNEAMWMLQEGTASAEDIDIALRMGFNHPMGPLELGDLTGWDTRLSVLQYLHSTLGEKFRPCPLIIKMVAAGRYGRKTGHGVYQYDETGKRISGSGLKGSAL